MANATIFDLVQETALNASDRFAMQQTSAATRMTSATFALMGGLVNASASPTTSNVTGVVGTLHLLDLSGLTANRNFILPDTAQIGERVGVFVSGAHASFVLNIVTQTNGSLINTSNAGGGTAWGTVSSVGEVVIARCVKAGGVGDTDWVVELDGRKAETSETYTATGTGAAARTLQSKLGDVVSVKDYGATGDGVTDDAAAIQAASDADLGDLYFPPGTYAIESTLTLRSHQHWRLDNDATIKWAGSAGGTMFQSDSAGVLVYAGLSGGTIDSDDADLGFDIHSAQHCRFGPFEHISTDDTRYSSVLMKFVADSTAGAGPVTGGTRHVFSNHVRGIKSTAQVGTAFLWSKHPTTGNNQQCTVNWVDDCDFNAVHVAFCHHKGAGSFVYSNCRGSLRNSGSTFYLGEPLAGVDPNDMHFDYFIPTSHLVGDETVLPAITAISKANPAVVTSASHGLKDGFGVYIKDADDNGMTQLADGRYFAKYVDDDNFSLYTDAALTTAVNSTSYGTYDGTGAKWFRRTALTLYGNAFQHSYQNMIRDGAFMTDTIEEDDSGGDITAITQANPAVCTSTAHGLTTGELIYIYGESTMTEVNSSNRGNTRTVTVIDANSFSLNGVDTSAASAATGDGKWIQRPHTHWHQTGDTDDAPLRFQIEGSGNTFKFSRTGGRAVQVVENADYTVANNDVIGGVIYRARDDQGALVDYLDLLAYVRDISNSSKDSELIFRTYQANTFTQQLSIKNGVTVGSSATHQGVGTLVTQNAIHPMNTNAKLAAGSGSPEGAVTAVVGSLYMRTDGGASTTLYVKESGTGNTGWVAK